MQAINVLKAGRVGTRQFMNSIMKIVVLLLALQISAIPPAKAEDVPVSLSPVPYDFIAPGEIASRLSTGPLIGIWADQVEAYGARAAVAVYYQPEAGNKTVLFSAYYFDAEKWDAAQNPDEPPPFGKTVVRGNGRVFSVAGPQDTIFDPETPDGQNVVTVSKLLQLPTSFRAVE